MAKKNVTIYQHRDINGNPVANLTPESAVYDKDGKRLDYKLAGMDIDKIKEAQDEALESIAAAEESMTKNIGLDTYPVFSDTKPYVKGEIVNYGGLLYEFTADHEAGAWIGTDARETSLIEMSGTTQEQQKEYIYFQNLLFYLFLLIWFLILNYTNSGFRLEK